MWPTINWLSNRYPSVSYQRLHFVSEMLARCRKIVGHYKHSHLAEERLQNIQDEPTRWDSTYYTLDHLVEQQRVISLYNTGYELPDHLNSNKWQLAEKIVKWTLFITHSCLLFYFVFRTHSICFRTTYLLQMVLGV